MLKYGDITRKIIGASYEVHKFLGNACLPTRQGFQEVICQRALAWEFSKAGLSFARDIEQEIIYKDLSEPIGTRRADFVEKGKVLAELRAIIMLENVYIAQILNYLRDYKLEVELQINIESKSLTYKRLVR
jgi:GxxExxY protein